MNPGDIVMFRKSRLSDRLTEGKLIGRSSLTNFEGERVFWSVEYGKRVKKSINIHENQIEGLKESK